MQMTARAIVVYHRLYMFAHVFTVQNFGLRQLDPQQIPADAEPRPQRSIAQPRCAKCTK